MKSLADVLEKFQPATLADLEQVSLFDRMDTKYIFHDAKLASLLTDLRPFYRVLQVDQKRHMEYQNIYFDTKDKRCFKDHHNGNYARYKFRQRKYEDSHDCYFEIKKKTNKRRTVKKRLKHKHFKPAIENDAIVFLKKHAPFHATDLLPSLDIRFRRITLMHKKLQDRITIDTGLVYYAGKQVNEQHHLVIAELKQNRSTGHSDFGKIIRKHHIHPLAISKYCLGVIHMYPEEKWNLFKPRLIKINRIVYGNTA